MKVILRRLTWLEEKAWLEYCLDLGLWGNTPVEYRGKLWWRVH